MIFLVAWYVQDLLQVALTSSLLAPEVFLLVLNFQSLQQKKPRAYWSLVALAGGLAMDMRWSGFLGFTAALYCLSVLFMRIFWFQVPKLGRGPGFYALSNLAFCAIVGAIRLAFWDWDAMPTGPLSVFALQIALSLPILLVLWLIQVLRNDEPQ